MQLMYICVFIFVIFINCVIITESFRYGIQPLLSQFMYQTFHSNRFQCQHFYRWNHSKSKLKSSSPFFDALISINPSLKERYFFPGHCGGKYLPYNFKSSISFCHDLPELDGLDNIHSPNGPLLESLQNTAKVFGAFKSYYLVNGSTGGILIAILTCVRWHQQQQQQHKDHSNKTVFLIGRDSHKSVFNGLDLADCDAVVLPCEHDGTFGVSLGVSYDDIKKAIETYGHQICGLLLTRPTYQGLALNSIALKKITDLCHMHSIPVVIDEAHGSHLKFLNDKDLLDGLSCGADIVVQSSHKTLNALSQCAMMHLNHKAFCFESIDGNSASGDNNTCERSNSNMLLVEGVLDRCFSMLTTTSPNAILLASLDCCSSMMGSAEGRYLLAGTVADALELKSYLRNRLSKDFSCIELIDDSPGVVSKNLVVDPLRLSIRFGNRDSLAIDEKMCKYDGVYCELNLKDCITYAIPMGARYSNSLTRLEYSLLKRSAMDTSISDVTASPTEILTSRSEIDYSSKKEITLIEVSKARRRSARALALCAASYLDIVGEISAETICLYPPGIPLVLKGEPLSFETLQTLLQLQQNILGEGGRAWDGSISLTGCSDSSLGTIRVLI